jgi:hypothetical protein
MAIYQHLAGKTYTRANEVSDLDPIKLAAVPFPLLYARLGGHWRSTDGGRVHHENDEARGRIVNFRVSFLGSVNPSPLGDGMHSIRRCKRRSLAVM